ncbi:MAG TPA: energy transducer TonB [Sphingobium sp.]|nr:energy transducer TonB [Sphingobium sp.]
MLGAAERFIADDVAPAAFLSADPPLASRDKVQEVYPIPGPRYGERRGINVPAVLLILLIHGVAIFGLLQARQHAQRVRETRLSVVNLLPPPPPPAADTPPPPPSAPQVVAPPPLVHVPTPPVPIATTPETPPVRAPVIPVISPAPVTAAPSAPAAPSTVQGGDLATQMVSGKPPRYPIESRRKREQGTVLLSLTLGIDGAVESLTIAQSSGFPRLDSAARDAVKGWRWKPTIRDGQPVKVKGVVEIPFVLRTEGA